MTLITLEYTKDGTLDNTQSWPHTDLYRFTQKKDFMKFVKCANAGRIHAISIKVERRPSSWIIRDIHNCFKSNVAFSHLQKLQIQALKHSTHCIDFCRMHSFLPNLSSLQLVGLRVKGIESVSQQLTYLQMSCVTLLSQESRPVLFSKSIQAIIITNSDLASLPRLDLRQSEALEVVDIFGCRMECAPLFSSEGALSFLNLANNNLTYLDFFPPRLCKIIVAGNKLQSLPDVPTHITYLDISRNPLKRLPSNILCCQRLKNIYLFNTEVDLGILEMRYVNRIQTASVYQAESYYDDSQNVHNSFVQQTFIKSCAQLFKDPIDADALFVSSGNPEADAVLHENFCITETHIVLQCTYKEVFDRVWNRIHSVQCLETKRELMQRLVEEILEGRGKCFTGQILRLVNSLVGFFDDIVIQISDSDQIHAKIKAHLARNMGKINRQQLAAELAEINVGNSRIQEWIEYLDEEATFDCTHQSS